MRPLPRTSRAFTLVEILVSTVVLAIIVLIMVSVTAQVSNTWRYTTAKTEQFRESRNAFDAITRRLSQATLNTYWDYDNATTPTKYERRSELRFISGASKDLLGAGSATQKFSTHCVFFQAPLGTTDTAAYKGFENLLNTWGYFVEFSDDTSLKPPFLKTSLPSKYRFRLKELRQPTELNQIYSLTSGKASTYTGKNWFLTPMADTKPLNYVLAANVVAMIITPRLSKQDEDLAKVSSTSIDLSPLAPNYLYDTTSVGAGTGANAGLLNSKNQLPPILQVTLVAIDELSASRLNLTQSSSDIFGISGKFTKSSDFSNDLRISGSADSLENILIKKRVNYRIFTTNVPIKGAKWSKEQLN